MDESIGDVVFLNELNQPAAKTSLCSSCSSSCCASLSFQQEKEEVQQTAVTENQETQVD